MKRNIWLLLITLALLSVACRPSVSPLPTRAYLVQVESSATPPIPLTDTSATVTATLIRLPATLTPLATPTLIKTTPTTTAISPTATPIALPSASPPTAATDVRQPVIVPASPTSDTPIPTDSPPPIPTDTSPPVSTNTPLPPVNGVLPYTIEPASPPTSNVGVWTTESTITILTYQFQQAFIPTAPDDSAYPYPRLDFGQVGPPVPQTYRAIHLENGYVGLTILPELGGRLYRWLDKGTGRQLLYQNPVIKPSAWGYRGWWLAAGGIEWAFPVEEHGLNEWRPWNVSVGGTSITVSDIDDRTGMEVGATISLRAGSSAFTIQPYAKNDTEQAHEYQLWLNAMLTLGGNTVSPETEFIVPASQVTIHSSGDGGVPGAGGGMSWPVHGGRAMNFYGNWQGHIGFFFPPNGFAALYDHAAQQGIVRSHAPGWPAGAKFFGPAGYAPSYWTDDNSNYVELWSGATSTFWANGILQPGQSVGWSEQWYPVSQLDGLTYANSAAALRLTENDAGVDVGLAVSSSGQFTVELYAGNQPIATWQISLSPGQAFRSRWTRDRAGELGLKVVDNAGTPIAQTGAIP